MGLINRFMALFRKKEDSKVTEIDILRLHQEIHAETMVHIMESLKNNDSFKSLVANAVTSLDNRIDQLEKVTNFLYDRAAEQEQKLSTLEDRTTKAEFTELANSTKLSDN